MVVLAIVTVIIMEIVSAAGSSTRVSNRAADATAQARLAFDRLGLDLTMVLKRRDADFFGASAAVSANGGYDPGSLMIFLSAVLSPGTPPGGNRGISLLSYRVAPHPENGGRACLQRAAMPVGWNGPSAFLGLDGLGYPVRLSASDPAFASQMLPGPADFDVLVPGVIAVVVGYQLYPDNQSVLLRDGTTTASGKAQGQIVYSPPIRNAAATPSGGYVDLQRIAAIVVGVVSLDLRSLKTLSPQNVDDLAAVFDTPDRENKLPVWYWMQKTGDLSVLPVSVPLPGRQAVRVFQRFFPITSFGGQER